MREIIAGLGVTLSLFLVSGLHAATIVLPNAPNANESQAANDLKEVWLKGTGETATVRTEAAAPVGEAGPWFFVGETDLGRVKAPLPVGSDRDAFRVLAFGGDRVILRGASPGGTALAADWYAQHAMGARWFWRGEIGEEIESLKDWKPADLDRVVTPAFLSTEIGGVGVEWGRRNGLHARLPHGHALAKAFPPELFEAHPDWFPLREGKRYRPAKGDGNWQPNLALPAVADYAAKQADDFFDHEPAAEGYSLSENDSVHFDQSDVTARARGPLRWFRDRPDYSDLVFGFMNRVADEVAKRHPDKFLSAYAYNWCENAPTFKVRPNVLPWLTADRTQYYDADFIAEDHALILLWCRSGAKVVGIYDYLYGAPFLIPRVTTRMTANSLKFAYHAGVRAYTAEANPHWAFDGPKLWVIAQLLTDPSQSIDGLLDEYYRRFWKEAAGPMRRFDERCERAWREQKGPAWWLKYYNDEDQSELFPPSVCTELKSDLDEARAKAQNPKVKARVAIVAAGFAATERFVRFCDARTGLSKAVAGRKVDWKKTNGLLMAYQRNRDAFIVAYEKALAAGAMSRVDIDLYFRNDPECRMQARLDELRGVAVRGIGSLAAEEFTGRTFVPVMPDDKVPPAPLSGARGHQARAPVELLKDVAWQTLKTPARLDDRTFVWSRGPWLGRGGPAEDRSIRVTQSWWGPRSVEFSHCRVDSLTQWVQATPGKIYRAKVQVKARVSSGNQTFLILNWMDWLGRYVGQSVIDRVPDGRGSETMNLLVTAEAPDRAAYVGVGIYVYNQTGSDYAEFSGLSLTEVPTPIDARAARP